MTEADFLALISGQRVGLAADLQRAALRVGSWIYRGGVTLRNLMFDVGLRRAHGVRVPVVSIGNLTTGGTGKTPFAAFVARWFADRGVSVAFVSRGYRAVDGSPNDEALVLAQLCPGVPHLQQPDRVASARKAQAELHAQLIILDDGFQHRRLHRDLDIVLIDALNPWGHGHLLPRGLLREPISSLRRAHLVAITRVDQASPEQTAAIRERVAAVRSDLPVIDLGFPPLRLINASGQTTDLTSLRHQSVVAFCGIGHPAAFFAMLAREQFDIRDTRAFPDHHDFTSTDETELSRWVEASSATAVVVTQKDLVKLRRDHLGGRPLWAVEIGARIVHGQDAWDSAVQTILAKLLEN
ncbi:MAG: tetraacyldisaccharide 4'-kinase [Planctomycetales bacterium]|nr:tetraacyldisaccharide 4'-kinase [Planctomycetales bacterium]